MADLNQHAVLVRTLVNHHAENIHSKKANDKNSKDICDSCFQDTLKPKHASQATYQTHLPPKSSG